MIRYLLAACFAVSTFSIEPDYLEWSDKPLEFTDFKASAPKGSGSKVNLSTMISFQTKVIQGTPPEITIYNRMDRNSSWISIKNEAVLKIQQIHFNTSELYARKIRKEMKRMHNAKVLDKEKYTSVIREYTNQLHKMQKSKKVLLEDQPHLINLWDKQINDSLKMYQDFAK